MVTNKIEQIKKMKKKAESSRNAYFILAKKYKRYSNILHFLILLESATVAILTFSDFTLFAKVFRNIKVDTYNLIIGIIAFIVFFLTLIEEFLKLSNKSAEYEAAGKQLTTFIRYSDKVEKGKTISHDDVNYLNFYYISLSEITPIIPDKIFIKAKQTLKKKIEISKKLDENPNLIIWIFKFKRVFRNLKCQLFKRGRKNGKR